MIRGPVIGLVEHRHVSCAVERSGKVVFQDVLSPVKRDCCNKQHKPTAAHARRYALKKSAAKASKLSFFTLGGLAGVRWLINPDFTVEGGGGDKSMPTIVQIDHPQTRKKPIRIISARDAIVVAFLPVQLFIAWCVPERFWRPIARMLQPLAVFLYVRGGASHTQNLIRVLMGQHSSAKLSRKIIQEVALGELITILEVLRDYRPDGWRPKIRLSGTHHLDEAQAAGKGAILWITYTHAQKLVSKLAIHRAGYSVSHLSRPQHGLSPTKFGARFLNRIQTTIESRYAGRIVIRDGELQKTLRSLTAHLRANRVISFMAHNDAARATATSFLEGWITLANGAFKLSYRTGAVLLPVFPYRDTSGMLNVEIRAPIDTRQAETEEASVLCAHRDYVAQLERFVLTYPGQWLGWYLHCEITFAMQSTSDRL